MFQTPLIAGWFQGVAGFLMFFGSLFLIMLVLVQRGRGGGLSGAFGGMGGQSAFGAKAGDTFTKITVITAAIWILLCMAAVRFTGNETTSVFDDDPSTKMMNTNSDLDGMGDSVDIGTSDAVLDQAAAAGMGDAAESDGESITDSKPAMEGAAVETAPAADITEDAAKAVESAVEAVETATDGQ